MSWINKAKDSAKRNMEKITEANTGLLFQKIKSNTNEVFSSVSKSSSEIIDKTKNETLQLVDDTKNKVKNIADSSMLFTSEIIEKSKSSIDSIDWKKITDSGYQKENIIQYWQTGTDKLYRMTCSTLEVDKNTMEMVRDLKARLPIPARSVDDIFSQCRNVALQRATAAFFLNGITDNIDSNSAEKYENLSESYKEYSDRIGGHNIRSHENFSKMKDKRYEAKNKFDSLEDGYNKGSKLNAYDADIEHVKSAKEVYSSTLLRAGTKDKELIDAINSEDNLIFTNSSVNRSKGAISLNDFLEKSEPHPTKKDVRTINIASWLHEINEADCKVALKKAEIAYKQHVTHAVMEIGSTAAKTGAIMAAQQIVGMIIVETIDIFMDEIQQFTKEFKLFDRKELINNVQELNKRLSDRLNQRFEEKQIWSKARELGIESGVGGALSVIPQILISTLIQLPGFILGMIREGTLSCVRSIRILASNDENKLESISIIMASTASAVAGLYISKIIRTGISSVPLLNRFDSQITSVLSELTVTAVPLIAIYTFDQNKTKLAFALKKQSLELA